MSVCLRLGWDDVDVVSIAIPGREKLEGVGRGYERSRNMKSDWKKIRREKGRGKKGVISCPTFGSKRIYLTTSLTPTLHLSRLLNLPSLSSLQVTIYHTSTGILINIFILYFLGERRTWSMAAGEREWKGGKVTIEEDQGVGEVQGVGEQSWRANSPFPFHSSHSWPSRKEAPLPSSHPSSCFRCLLFHN